MIYSKYDFLSSFFIWLLATFPRIYLWLPIFLFKNSFTYLEQSRRDDLESIGYVLLYFLLGILPWQNMKAKNDDERYRKIYEKKNSIKSIELCRDLPGMLTILVIIYWWYESSHSSILP